MYQKIKSGYDLFIRRNQDNHLVGTLTLRDEKENYIDIDPVESEDMELLEKYPIIKDKIDQEHAFFISYDQEKKEFFTSFRTKSTTGEYNDIVIWNHDIVKKDQDLFQALNRLQEKVQNKEERSFSK